MAAQVGGLGGQDAGVGGGEGGMKMWVVVVLVVAPLVVLGVGLGVICEYTAIFFHCCEEFT